MFIFMCFFESQNFGVYMVEGVEGAGVLSF